MSSQITHTQSSNIHPISADLEGGVGGNCPWALRSGGPPASLQLVSADVSLSHTGHNWNIVTHYALKALPFNLPNWQIKWQ